MQLSLRSVYIFLFRFILLLLEFDIASRHMLLIAMNIFEPLIIIVPNALLNCSG